jgi:hypothetical protein
MSIPTAAAVLKVAASQIGYREGRNNANKYGEFYGANNTAWCAQFIYWCVRQAGAEKGELITKTAWCPDLLDDARRGRHGQKIVRDPARGDRSGEPRPGDIGLVQRPGQPNGAKHVFFVEKYLGDGRVQTIEGNTSNTGSATGDGVYRLKRQLTDLIVILRPAYTGAPAGGGGGGGGSKPAPKTDVYHIDPAKVSSFLWGHKGGDRPNVVGRPGRNLDIERFSGKWAITPSNNWFHRDYLRKGKYVGSVSPAVDLSKLVEAAKKDPGRKQGGTTSGATVSVKVVEACLVELGLLTQRYGEDGSFGSSTVEAYAKWQRKCGYSGKDADGIPGRDSLERLVEPWGYRVKG